MFTAADVDQAKAPRQGAPVTGDQRQEAWARAAETFANEIQSLPALARQFLGRLSRELEIVGGRGTSGFGQGTVADGVRRLRTATSVGAEGFVFNLRVVKAHVMRDLMGISHAKVARELQVSTSSLYELLGAWKAPVATGALPAQKVGTETGVVGPVSVDPAVLKKIAELPAQSQGAAFLRAAREVDPDAVRTTGRRSRTLSSKEIAYMKHKEATVAPHIMSDPGGSDDASPMELAIGQAYTDNADYDEPYDSSAFDSDDAEDLDDRYDELEQEEIRALELDAADAGIEEYEAAQQGRIGPEPDPCVCAERVELWGPEADSYVCEHLEFSGRDESSAGLYLCPSTGRKWHQDWPHAGPSSWGDTRLRQLR